MDEKLRVVLIFGGRSAEHEISVFSAASIYKALDKDKNQVSLLWNDPEGSFFLVEEVFFKSPEASAKKRVCVVPGKASEAFVLMETGESVASDVVFPVFHGPYGEDGTIQGLLKFVDLPFVGSCVLSTASCMDKVYTKRLLEGAGLPVSPYLAFESWEKPEISFEQVKAKLSLPFFVKPASQGSSLGISKVIDEKTFYRALDEAFSYDSRLLIEEGLEARELEIAVLGHGGKVKASCPGEILTDHDFYTYEAKYLETESLRLIIPAKVPKSVPERMKEYALKAFKVMGCSGMARCDFFYKKDGSLFINELNTIPGFTEFSMYPKLWEGSGLAYPDLIQRLLDLAVKKHGELKTLKTRYTPSEEEA